MAETENPAAGDTQSSADASSDPVEKTPEEQIAELNQKITDLQDNFLRAKAEGEKLAAVNDAVTKEFTTLQGHVDSGKASGADPTAA